MKSVLFGGTDLALRIGETLVGLGMPPVGVIYADHAFGISYSPGGAADSKFADMAHWAQGRGIGAHEYESVDATIAILQRLDPGVGIAAGWYHRLPSRLRRLFTRGVLGIRASLLPKFRGGAPLNWTLLRGEREFPTGSYDHIGDLVARANGGGGERISDLAARTNAGHLNAAQEHAEVVT